MPVAVLSDVAGDEDVDTRVVLHPSGIAWVGPVGQCRRHVDELTRHVHELHERLERMEHAIRELSERRDD